MQQVKEKITNGEISQDTFLSVTEPKIIQEAATTEAVIMSEEAKITNEASNTLQKSASTPAAAKTNTNPLHKKAKIQTETSNPAMIRKGTSNLSPKSASIPAATEMATLHTHDGSAQFVHNKEKNKQDVDEGGTQVSR